MNTSGMLIAATAAALLTATPAFAGDKKKAEAKVHCMGVNECKGKGACAGVDHGCAGLNTCKGKGWIELTAKDCKAKGGTVMKPAEASPTPAPAPADEKKS